MNEILNINKKAPKNIFALIFAFILIIAGSLFFTKSVTSTTAKTWDFSTPSDYTYDNTKIEISSGQTQLKTISSPDWYNPNWNYRKEITIDNSNNSNNLTNYQINISLNNSNFDCSKTLSNGEDIRFVDYGTGTTELNSWIENYSTTCSTTNSVWVKVPLITANSTKKIYLYYGLNTTPNLKGGITTDVHGTNDSGTKLGSNTVANIGDFVSRMNNIFHPDFSVDIGDRINNINHDADYSAEQTIKNAYDGLNNNHYYTIGNHDIFILTKTELQTALGIDYNHKSIDVGNYHIIILDAELGDTSGHVVSSEKTWLTTELANTNKKTIVFVHQGLGDQSVALNPYFSGDPASAKVDNSSEVRTILENSGKVIAVFHGHTHWDNNTTINGIPYIYLNSLVENNSDEWAEISIYNNQLLNIVFRQADSTKNFLVWDFVNKKWFNQGNQVFSLFDNFDGDSGQWSASAGNWKISQGGGYLRELAGGAGSDRILKSTYSEDTNYIAQGKINLYGGANVMGGFSSRITDISNFDAFYSSSSGLYWAWKQMVAGIWGQVSLTNGFTSDLLWHNIKLVKIGNSFNLYYDNVSTASGTNSSLSDSFFGLWNFQNPIEYDNIFVRQYTTPEPTNSLDSDPEVAAYSGDNPTIQPVSAISFTSLSGFSETAIKNGGEIKYQISNDGGTTWYWYNSGWTTTSSGYQETNTANDINTNISTFPVGSGSFLFKAYLHSSGSQLIQLNSVILNYINDITPPSTPIASPISGTYNTTQSITLSTTEGAHIRYSLTGIPTTCSDGTLYEGPISVAISQTIYARACDNMENSSIASFAYIISSYTSSGSSGSSVSSYNNLINNSNTQVVNNLKKEIPPNQINSSVLSIPIPITITRILKLTAQKIKGEDVKKLQNYLNTKGYNCGIPDGIFGIKTKNAVIKFQLTNKLKGDGIVGHNTIDKINQLL